MGIARRDDWLTDAQGRALAGAAVYYCNQPATTTVIPPSPLANIFSNLTSTPEANPQFTDGFGHAIAYADATVLYTIVYVHPLFGPNPVVLIDQSFGGGTGGGSGVTTFQGVPSGTINGINTVFTFAVPSAPKQFDVWLNIVLIPSLGYTSSWAGGTLTITFAVAPQAAAGGVAADALYVQGFY